MCGSMVGIQSPTAENRQGKKRRKMEKPQDKNIMSASATQGGHNESQGRNFATKNGGDFGRNMQSPQAVARGPKGQEWGRVLGKRAASPLCTSWGPGATL